MGKNIAIIGSTGTGKTTDGLEIAQSIEFTSVSVFDINHEIAYANKGFRLYHDESKSDDMQKFVDDVAKLKDNCVIFDEAVLFFRHGMQTKPILRQMVQRRHRNVINIFNFHAIHQIPIYITDYVDEMILHHTNDSIDAIKRFKGRTKIEDAFNDLFEERNGVDLDKLEIDNPTLFKQIKHNSICIKTAV